MNSILSKIITAYLDRIKRQAYRQVVEKVWDQIFLPIDDETGHSVPVWTEMKKFVR
jgi:hypothetical protein